MKIFITEDDLVSRRILKKILTKVPGAEVTEAVDGLSAWQMLCAEAKPDMLILDNLLPGLSGLDLLERVRGDERLKDLPVIMCTACGDRNNVSRAAKLGVRHYILKPYRTDIVLQRVEEVGNGLARDQVLEEPVSVCRRLSIPTEGYRERLNDFLNGADRRLSAICVAVGGGMISRALEEIAALKLACGDLGVNVIATDLSRLETALQDPAMPVFADKLLLSSIETEKVGDVLALLARLRQEHQRLAAAATSDETTAAHPATAPSTPSAAAVGPALAA